MERLGLTNCPHILVRTKGEGIMLRCVKCGKVSKLRV